MLYNPTRWRKEGRKSLVASKGDAVAGEGCYKRCVKGRVKGRVKKRVKGVCRGAWLLEMYICRWAESSCALLNWVIFLEWFDWWKIYICIWKRVVFYSLDFTKACCFNMEMRQISVCVELSGIKWSLISATPDLIMYWRISCGTNIFKCKTHVKVNWFKTVPWRVKSTRAFPKSGFVQTFGYNWVMHRGY